MSFFIECDTFSRRPEGLQLLFLQYLIPNSGITGTRFASLAVTKRNQKIIEEKIQTSKTLS